MIAERAHTKATAHVTPELLGSVPRDVQFTGSGIAMLILAVALAVAAVVAPIAIVAVNARADATRQLRDREGVSVDAEVTGVTIRRGDNPRRIVTYQYELNGRTYIGRTTLRGNARRDLVRGVPIRVEYRASNPEESWMAGDRPDGTPLWAIPLVSLPLLVSAAGVAWSVRRQWILLSEGRGAQARVIAVKKVWREERRAFRVSYEFQTLSGATQTARSDVRKPVPAVGTRIPIVYHRDRPSWSAKYPLQFVRPRRMTAS